MLIFVILLQKGILELYETVWVFILFACLFLATFSKAMSVSISGSKMTLFLFVKYLGTVVRNGQTTLNSEEIFSPFIYL